MTEKEFKVFTEETIPQALFHVSAYDVDEESGGLLEEVILIKLIANNLGCLKHQPLSMFFQVLS